MNLTDKQLLLIQKYLDNDLNDLEKKEFEAHLKNKDFNDQLLFQAQLVDKLGSDKDKRIDTKSEHIANGTDNKLRVLLLRLATAVLLIFAILFAMIKFTGSSNQKSFKKYYTSYPPNIDSPNTDANSEYALAMQDYTNKDFQKALNRLQAIPEQNEDLSLYIANCLLELGADNEALKLYGGLEKSINSKYRHSAEWYTTLIHLRNEDASYKEKLNEILSEQGHAYYEKAMHLSEDLE